MIAYTYEWFSKYNYCFCFSYINVSFLIPPPQITKIKKAESLRFGWWIQKLTWWFTSFISIFGFRLNLNGRHLWHSNLDALIPAASPAFDASNPQKDSDPKHYRPSHSYCLPSSRPSFFPSWLVGVYHSFHHGIFKRFWTTGIKINTAKTSVIKPGIIKKKPAKILGKFAVNVGSPFICPICICCICGMTPTAYLRIKFRPIKKGDYKP